MRSKILTTPLMRLLLIWFFAIPVVSGLSLFDLPWDLPAPAGETLDAGDDDQQRLIAVDPPALLQAPGEVAAARFAAGWIPEYSAGRPHPGPIALDHPSRGPPRAHS